MHSVLLEETALANSANEPEIKARLLPLLRAFVEERRRESGLETQSALEAKGFSYNALMAALSPSKKTFASRKLLDQIVNELCRVDGVVDPWLASEAYTRAGQLWVQDVTKHHTKAYQPGDEVFVNLPTLAFIPFPFATGQLDESKKMFRAEEAADAIVRSAGDGATYVFILSTDRWDLGQAPLNRASKKLGRGDKWKERIHWIYCEDFNARVIPCVFVRRGFQPARGFFPLLARGVDGRPEWLPYAFAPLDELTLEVVANQLKPVFELVRNPDRSPIGGLRYQPWEDLK